MYYIARESGKWFVFGPDNVPYECGFNSIEYARELRDNFNEELKK